MDTKSDELKPVFFEGVTVYRAIFNMYLYRVGYLKYKTMPPGSVKDPDLDPDPDPHGSAFILVAWIRIRIWEYGSGSRRAKLALKVKMIQVLKCS